MVQCIVNYIRLSFCLLQIKKQHLAIKEKRRWKKAFFHFLRSLEKESSDYPGRWDLINGFAGSDIRIVKKAWETGKNVDPILICVVLNEIERLRLFLDHYRRIGIKRFAFLDNGSTDKTVEYLNKQNDVELFQTTDAFESKKKAGWINRIISYYGTAHWYLVVDADEFLVWQGAENVSIQDLVRYFARKRIKRVRAMMVDMYPREAEWGSDKTFEEIYPKCRYFDYNTYFRQGSKELYLINGGPRKRKLGMDAWLTKYPLFCLQENELFCNPHVIYPYETKWTPCYFALLHYKFLTREDQRKMRKYARKGNYAHDSVEYRLYVKKHCENADNFHFYYEDSVEYQSSESLAKIKEITKIPLQAK